VGLGVRRNTEPGALITPPPPIMGHWAESNIGKKRECTRVVQGQSPERVPDRIQSEIPSGLGLLFVGRCRAPFPPCARRRGGPGVGGAPGGSLPNLAPLGPIFRAQVQVVSEDTRSLLGVCGQRFSEQR
jgi:hypothetical protein